MTGADLCRRFAGETEVLPGTENAYWPSDRLITLRTHVYGGSSSANLTVAAHEAGHAEQHWAVGWVAPSIRWLLAGRLLLEWDASRRARRMLAQAGLVVNEAALEATWRAYLVPAYWQAALLLTIVIAAVWLRK